LPNFVVRKLVVWIMAGQLEGTLNDVLLEDVQERVIEAKPAFLQQPDSKDEPDIHLQR